MLLAIDRRARVSIRPSTHPGVIVKTTSEEEAAGLPDVPLMAAAVNVIEQLGRFDPARLDGHRIELDTAAFYEGREKLGLGSSAALMVAVVRALNPQDPVNPDLLALTRECHCRFQGGLGSGADVATSLVGGCIRFEPGQFPSPVNLPADLHLLLIWTGKGASTATYVKRLAEWRLSRPRQSAAHMDEICRLSAAAIGALQEGHTATFVDKVGNFNDKLVELSDVSGLGFYTPRHQSLQSLVEAGGCVYKPSGAGGGDFGIAFSADSADIDSLNESLKGKGYLTLRPSRDRVPASEVCFEE